MCKYCELEENLYDDGEDYSHIIKTNTGQYGIESFTFIEGLGYEGMAFKIEFCPKCGCKLN